MGTAMLLKNADQKMYQCYIFSHCNAEEV